MICKCGRRKIPVSLNGRTNQWHVCETCEPGFARHVLNVHRGYWIDSMVNDERGRPAPRPTA